MSAKSCPRAWQAEAVLDGVLSKADRESFDRHLPTCSECSAERDALARLEQVAARTPSFASTALRRRALHNELLRRANEISLSERPKPSRRRALWFVLAAAALGVALSFVVPFARLPFGRGNEPRFDLVATRDSRWHFAERGRTLRLALAAGTYTLSVKKLEAGQRFLLNLPDGELEVRGTHFIVEIEGRRTRRVAVTEGRVALRVQAREEVLLGAGEAWPTAVTTASSAPSPSVGAALATASATASAPNAPPATTSTPRGAVAGLQRERVVESAAPAASAKSTASAAPTMGPSASGSSPTRASAANDFADAMAVFAQGDFGTAERLFRTFEERHPTNSHVEDVLFLRALARSRRGDQAGARDLAREYLRRYPKGFRAAEAKRMTELP